MKYNKTKYPNIYTYETKKGKRYYVRRNFKINGKKKETTASNLKTLAEARHALAEIETKINNNEYDHDKNLTVNDYWQIYSENRIKTGRWAPDTIANKESQYRVCFKDRFGSVKLKDIERTDYEQFIAQLLKRYTRISVIQIHGIFDAMINDAVVNGYLDRNPLSKIFIGKSVIPAKEKSFPLEDFKTWDKCARKVLDIYNYTIVRLTYFGARRSEVMGIRISSLKLIGTRFRILLDDSRTFRRPNGKGMKTKGSERYMIVDEETTTMLQKCIEITKEIAKKAGRILSRNDYLFLDDGKRCRADAGKPVTPTRVYTNFKRVNKHCEVHVTPHMMRHFFTTQAIIAGVSIEHMAAALGHSTSYMTQKYTHIKDEVASEVTDSFLRAIQ
ncbi:integrase [Streptococcus phage Javan220]|nr:integrase [Streptococcus phage Javan220]SFR59291.1 Phage integrase, N-terminal SAM-like domain [Streptococcus equinus]